MNTIVDHISSPAFGRIYTPSSGTMLGKAAATPATNLHGQTSDLDRQEVLVGCTKIPYVKLFYSQTMREVPLEDSELAATVKTSTTISEMDAATTAAAMAPSRQRSDLRSSPSVPMALAEYLKGGQDECPSATLWNGKGMEAFQVRGERQVLVGRLPLVKDQMAGGLEAEEVVMTAVVDERLDARKPLAKATQIARDCRSCPPSHRPAHRPLPLAHPHPYRVHSSTPQHRSRPRRHQPPHWQTSTRGSSVRGPAIGMVIQLRTSKANKFNFD
ncbi:hypothetical protein BD410DRAFT_852930 [Rickenella mellea]|uniref:Uncharacterized protein n=1 Tax=Rickenella mellea TaxID=50990 RepID=A0A4Y7Q9Z3_9AGAM|nr:hypothetical protein BD410DRAFT_852930 [Rickenella mellea]